jgi:hypothetical protein
VKFGDAKVDPYISLEADRPRIAKASSVTKRSCPVSEYDVVSAQMTSWPRSELSCLLMLVQPERWMKGLWGEEREGWHDTRTNTFLSFDAARQLIADRIKELGLDATLVNAYPHSSLASRGETIADEMVFYRLPFDQRMLRFKQ